MWKPVSLPILTVCFSLAILMASEGMGRCQMGSKVLIYCGNGNECADGVKLLSAQLLRSGASDVLYSDKWPVNLAEYRLIFLWRSHHHYSVDQVEQMRGFVAEGGRVVLVCEFTHSYNTDMHDTFNNLLERLDCTMRVIDGEHGCEILHDTKQIHAHPLTYRVGQVQYCCSAAIELGQAKPLISAESVPFVAVEKTGIILTVDSNIFCDPDQLGQADFLGDNLAFITNLFTTDPRKKDPFGN